MSPKRSLLTLALLSQCAYAWIPSAQDVAFLGAGETFPEQRMRSWSLDLGAAAPWGMESLVEAYARLGFQARTARLGVGVAQSKLDSLWQETGWEGDAQVDWENITLTLRSQFIQQTVPGMQEKWDMHGLVALNIVPGEAWTISLGLATESCCLSPSIGLQWIIGDSYRMQTRLKVESPHDMHLMLGQEFLVAQGLRLSMGWRLPNQTIAIGLGLDIASFRVAHAKTWNPSLPTGQALAMQLGSVSQ